MREKTKEEIAVEQIDGLIRALVDMGETLYANDDEIDTEVIIDTLNYAKQVIKENKEEN